MVKIGSVPVNLIKKTEPRLLLLKNMLILHNLNLLRESAVVKFSILQLKIENLKEKNAHGKLLFLQYVTTVLCTANHL